MSLNHTIVCRFLVTSAIALAIPMAGFAQETPASGAERPARSEHRAGMRGGEHRMRHDEGLFDPRILRRLDLSQAQRDQIRRIVDEGRDARRQQRDALLASRKALHELVVGGQYSEAKAKELAATFANQESAHILAMADLGNRVMQVLSPEQRAKLKAGPKKD